MSSLKATPNNASYLSPFHLSPERVVQFKEYDPKSKDVHLLVVLECIHLLWAHVEVWADIPCVLVILLQWLERYADTE